MAYRKLQQEVERVFKRIHEGLEVFNYYYERHENAVNSSQKEKLESDLKKEIKKLQRFREQIKNWQTANEYKDHDKLLDHRRLVETAMEKYKVVEKGSKTKAYSNESIRQASEMGNLDDANQEKIDAVEFIELALQELQKQIETLEADYESYTNSKKSRYNDEKIEEIDQFLNRDGDYQDRLENILTALYNDSLKPESLLSIKDDITYFLESNQEPDFAEDDTLFDELHIGDDDVEYDEDDTEDISFYNSTTEEIIPEPPIIQREPLIIPPTKQIPRKSEIPTSIPIPVPKKIILKNVTNINGMNGHLDSSSHLPISTLKPATVPIRPAGELKWSTAAAASIKEIEQERVEQEIVKQLTPMLESKTPMMEIVQPSISKPAPISESSEKKPSLESNFENGLSTCEKTLFNSTNLIRLPPGLQDVIISHIFTRFSSPLESNKFLRNNCDNYEPFQIPTKNPFNPNGSAVNNNLNLKSSGRDVCGKKWNCIRFNNTPEDIITKFQNELQLAKAHNHNELFDELNLILFYGLYHSITPIEWKICYEVLTSINWIQVNECFWILNSSNMKFNLNTSFHLVGDYKTFNLIEWKIMKKLNYKLTNEDFLKPFSSDVFKVRNEISKSRIGCNYLR